MTASDRGQIKIETRTRAGVSSRRRTLAFRPLAALLSASAARRRFLGATALVLCAGAPLLGATARAQNILPTGGKVVSGGAAIGAPSGAGLSINQTSARAIVNWGSFSIGQPNSVTFNQPNAASAILNRVTGATTSTLAGQLNANGQVYLVNPNGIAITKTGAVKVGGGFVASTLDISNRDFNAGALNYVGAGASASVSNAGSITAAPGGFVVLLGGSVSNSGAISVPLGKVGLGSGERATLDLTGDGFLQVAAPTQATTADGRALVDVSGKIKAAGGSVQLKAATVAAAVRDVVNVSGVVSASSARARGGAIVLGGGPGGDVRATGRLLTASRHGRGGTIVAFGANVSLSGAKVSAKSKAAQGGTVAIMASNAVALASTAIEASGARGGGKVNIGGARAKSAAIDAATTIKADATTRGQGGAVAILSNGATTVHGLISAQGGPQGGDGGRIDTSGRTVDFAGLSVNASAAFGKAGSWLLDPTDLIIDATAAATIDNILNGGANVSLQTSATGAPTGPAGTTGNTNASGNGDIIDNAAIAWSTAATLTLSAYHAIAVNAPITIGGAGGLVLATNNNVGGTSSGGALTIAPPGSVSFTGAEGGGQSLTINGTPYTLIYTMAELDAIDGVSAINGAAVATYGPGLGGAYALADDLVATTTYTSALIASGDSSGSAPLTEFGGTLEGLGHTISNLTIAAPSTTNFIGLIGESSGVVRDIGLVGGSVSGGTQVGGLMGVNDGPNGVITQAYASDTVSGLYSVGGLAGENWGVIAQAYATGAVIDSRGFAGGLVGYNNGLITQAHATGAVNSAGGLVGGLVGQSDTGGAITQAYATGAISGASRVGGLVGQNGGPIAQAYATGAVNGAGRVGGLVGENFGSIAQAYATGAVNGSGYNVGGLAGYNNASITQAYATGAVTGAGSNIGGLVGLSDPSGAITQAYAAGAVSGANEVGGLVGSNYGAIGMAYATGAVLGSGDDAGGLAGYNAGVITQVYATGAVDGFSGYAGGLVGYNNATITQAYATGAVSADFGNIGGLIGYNAATVSNSYFDVLTTGLSGDGVGGTAVGLTTAQLQGTGTPAGFGLGAAFSGGGAGGQSGLYPYLTYFFPNGVQAISGFAYADRGVTPLSSPSGMIVGAPAPGVVSGLVNGAGLGSVTTGANGYYYLMVSAGTIGASPNQILVTESGPANGASVTGATLQENAAVNPALANLNIYGNYLKLQADPSETSLAATIGALNGAAGNGAQPASAAAATLLAGLTKLEVDAGASFTFDTPLASVPLGGALNTLVVNAGGAVAQTQAFTTANLLLLGSGGFTFANAANQVATLAAAAPNGAISLTSLGTLTIGDVEGVSGVGAAGGAVILNAGAIAQGPPDAYLAANTLTANALNGIGAAALPLQTILANLALSNAANGIYVANAGDAIVAAANGGDIQVATSGNLTVGTVGALTGVAASGSGAVLLRAGGGVTLEASVSSAAPGNALTLVGGGAFADRAGSGALSAANGRWLVYSQDPAQDNRGGLAFAFKQYNTAFDGAFANIQGTGDGFVYTLAPVVSLTGLARTYDGTTNATLVPGAYTLTGAVDGDVVTLSGSGAFATKNAGTGIDVAMANLAVATAMDGGAPVYGYQAAAPGPGNAIGTITPAPLLLSASADAKTYDGTTASSGAVGSSGLAAGDTLSGLSQSFGGKNVGPQTLSVNSGYVLADGANGQNYIVTTQTAQGAIIPAPLTVTADNRSKTYGEAVTFAGSAFTATGLQNGETIGAVTLASAGAAANASVAGGPYAISVSNATGGAFDARNYAIAYVNGALTVNPATLTYRANPARRLYGSANPELTGAITGFVGADNQANATTGALSFTSPATALANVGAYAILGSGLSAANYVFVNAAANAAALTIAPKPLTAALKGAVSKTYDGGTAAALAPANFVLNGFVAGQSANVTQALGTYAGANAGTGIEVGATLQPKDFTAGPATLLSNYLLPASAAADVGTIAPAVLTYIANPAARFFGAPNPAFTGVVTGFVAGENLATATKGALGFTSAATANTAPGVYAIDGSGLVADNGNYVFAQAPSNAAALLIAQPFLTSGDAGKFAPVSLVEAVDATRTQLPFVPAICIPPNLSAALEKFDHVLLAGMGASCDQ